MASKLYEIAFELGAKLDSTFNGAFSDATKQINALKLAAGAAVIGAGIGVGVGFAEDLQKSLNKVQAATGSSDGEMQNMQDSMLSIYNNNFGENFEDIGAAMTTISQQSGLSGKSLQDLTQNALLLRDTFDFEVNESFRSAKMMADQFGISTENAYNLMAQGAQSGLDKNGDLLDSINEYSVHFKQMGFDSDQMFNMFANGTAAGTFSVDKLGDAVKEFGIRSKDGSKATMTAFQQLGLDANQLSGDFATGGEKGKAAFDVVNKALLGMNDPLLQNQIGVALWGSMWEDLGTQGISSLTNVEGKISSTKNALQAINDIKYSTFGEALGGIKRQMQTGILLPVGQMALPLMNKFANFLNGNLPSAIGVVKSTIEGFGSSFNAVMNPFFQMLGEGESVTYAFWMSFKGVFGEELTGVISDFIAFVEFGLKGLIAFIQGDIGKAGDLFYGMFPDEAGTQGKVNVIIGGLSLVKEGIEATIATAKDLGGYITNNWSSIEPIIKGIALAVTAYKIAQLGLNIAAKAGMIIQSLTKAYQAGAAIFEMYRMGATVASIAQWALNTAMAANPAIVIAIGIVALIGVILLLVKSWDTIKAVMASFWAWIQKTFSGIGGWFSKVFAEAVQGIKSVFNGIGAWFSGVFNDVVNGVAGAFSGISAWFSNVFNSINTAIQGVLVGIAVWFISIWNSIVAALSPVLNGISVIVGAVFDVIKSIVLTGIEIVIVLFKTAILGISVILQGISECASWVASVIIAKWNQFIGVVAQIWQSLVSFITPIIQGLINIVSSVMNSISGVIAAVISIIVTKWNELVQAILQVWQNIVSFINPIIQGIANIVSGVFEGIKSILMASINFYVMLFQTGIAAIQAIIQGISITISEVVAWIGGQWQWLMGVMSQIWQQIIIAVQAFIAFIGTLFQPVVDGISATWQGFLDFMAGIWDGISSGARSLVDGITGFFTPLLGWLEEKFTWVSSTWGNIKEFFGVDVKSKGVAASAASEVQSSAQFARGGMSRVGYNANGTNNWRGGLTWVGERGPELINLARGSQVIPNSKVKNVISNMISSEGMQSAANVPKFAKGGIVNEPQLAMVGDNPSGKEAIIPIENTSRAVSLWNAVGSMLGIKKQDASSGSVLQNINEASNVSQQVNNMATNEQSSPALDFSKSINNTTNNKTGGDISVVYSPVYHINSETDKAQIEQTSKQSFGDFESKFREILRQERRLSYE